MGPGLGRVHGLVFLLHTLGCHRAFGSAFGLALRGVFTLALKPSSCAFYGIHYVRFTLAFSAFFGFLVPDSPSSDMYVTPRQLHPFQKYHGENLRLL